MNSTNAYESTRVQLFVTGLPNTWTTPPDTIPTHETNDPNWIILSFSVPLQEQVGWCWAATTLGIVRYYDPGNPTSQCEAVNLVLHREDACDDPTNPEVNEGWYMDRALHRFGVYSGGSYGGLISPQNLVAEFRRRRPVVVDVHSSRGGHAVAITGVTGDGKRVCLSDSLDGNRTISYEELRSYKGGNVEKSHRTKSRWD